MVVTSCHNEKINNIPGRIVVGIERYPDNLDPRMASDAISQKISKLIYSGLLKKDESLNLVPDLAKSIKTPDEKTYYVSLRTDVYFHNGNKLTSQDVKATYESIMNGIVRSHYKSNLLLIDKLKTPDDKTLIIKLKETFVPFEQLLTIGILPKKLAMKKELTPNDYVGTGAYSFVKNQKDGGDFIFLKKYPKYHGEKVLNEEIVFRVIKDANLLALELLNGRLDLSQNNISYVLLSRLAKEKSLKLLKTQGINFSYVAFNLRNPFLKHKKVREAIAHAIDRDKIIKYKLFGMAEKADTLLSPGHWAKQTGLKPFQFDIEAAKQLLDEAGFVDPDGDGPKERFHIVYKTSSNKDRLEIVQLIAENLKKIGIGVTIKSYEFGTFYRDIRQGSFDMYSLTWVGISDPDIYHFAFHSEQIPPHGANRGFYMNKDLDRLLDQSRTTLDLDKRKKIIQKIQEMVYQGFVYVPLWYESTYAVVQKNLRGVKLRADAGFTNFTKIFKVKGK